MRDAAVSFYRDNQTMEHIARNLGVSRSSVSRLLKQARQLGLVRIQISEEADVSTLSEALQRDFGVRAHVVMVPATATDVGRLDRVSQVAADILTDLLGSNATLGVAWGMTMLQMASHLTKRPLSNVTVVQMNGGAGPFGSGIQCVGETLQRLTAAFGAKAVLFPVPAFFDTVQARTAMWEESSIRWVLRWRDQIDTAVFGVGCLTAASPSSMYASGFISQVQLRELFDAGVVGDVCTVMLRQDGTWNDIPLNDHSTGVTPDQLRRVPVRLCVVADPRKAPAVLAALYARVATDLVIDDKTARAVLAQAKADPK